MKVPVGLEGLVGRDEAERGCGNFKKRRRRTESWNRKRKEKSKSATLLVQACLLCSDRRVGGSTTHKRISSNQTPGFVGYITLSTDLYSLSHDSVGQRVVLI